MKIVKKKIFLYIFSVILLLVLGILIGMASSTNKINNSVVTKSESNGSKVLNDTQELSLSQLEEIAQSIIKGTIRESEYGYEDGVKVVGFDIVDVNGINRELTLYASDGRIYDIDYDYDKQGNRFINQSYFDVNITFEQAKDIAISNVQGNIVAYKQDVYRGLFIYNFAIQAQDGVMYEVHVETKNGRVLKVKTNDNYNYDDYTVRSVDLLQSNNEQVQQNQNSSPEQNEFAPQQNQDLSNQQNLSYKSEQELRQIVLSKVPGIVEYYYKDWDDGMLEYNYKIKTSDNSIVEVEINANGRITDIDYEDYFD